MKYTIKSMQGEVLSQLDNGTRCREIAQLLANDHKEDVYIYDNINKKRTLVRFYSAPQKIGVHVRIYPEDAKAIRDLAKKLNYSRETGIKV